MKKIVSYCCEICDEEFDNEIDAKKCEEMHSICRCQAGTNPEEDKIHVGFGYGKSECIYVDFEIPAIVRNYIDDGSRPYKRKDYISIKYCPFCGREL